MALFTDGNISTIDDLAAHDSGVMGIAAGESIDLTRKLTLAQDELGVELAAMMPRLDPYGTQLTQSDLGNVVVTAPLRLWHVFHTLEMVYRDAYNNQLNDRYRGKWEQYRELSGWAMQKLLETGVGMVADPVAQAAAPQLNVVPGEPWSAEATYYVRVAWVNAAGEEGAASACEMGTAPDGMILEVRAVRRPENAAGWNVYVGFSGDEQTLQNTAPLDPGGAWNIVTVETWGRMPGDGQRPSYVRAVGQVLQRG